MRNVIFVFAIIASLALLPSGALGAGAAKTLKMTDALHNQYSLIDAYALADALLNATWKQVKPNVSDAAYRQILKEQREWTSKGRDDAAGRYAASMPDMDAYIKAMQDRTADLVKIVASQPQNGKYEAKYASFTAVVQANDVLIEGDAYNHQGNTCIFDGKGERAMGWITMKHSEFPDFYLLFTPKGAHIAYATSGESQGCGANVGFNDSYVKK